MIPNILVPKHELLDAESAQKLLEKYQVTRNEFPKIRKSDAALVDIKPKTGDIIKITRYHPAVGESDYYRVVIEG
ncbi:MAG: DNA-directed RNA polymerase subunit H [Candidatus Altiarchaeota archaeon]|nr:DNA-directed RNA polymerase subunit H [Candidatus Altiarchaeota archaeon]